MIDIPVRGVVMNQKSSSLNMPFDSCGSIKLKPAIAPGFTIPKYNALVFSYILVVILKLHGYHIEVALELESYKEGERAEVKKEVIDTTIDYNIFRTIFQGFLKLFWRNI